jgi:hypothetical protein
VTSPLRLGARLLGALVLLAIVGSLRSATAQSRKPLAGRWTLTVWSDAPATPGTATASGTVVLVEVAGAAPVTWRGSYQLPLSSLGKGPDAGPAMARVGRGDTVRVVLNPSVDDGRVELVGVFSPAAIEGRWSRAGQPAGSGGRFALRPQPR